MRPLHQVLIVDPHVKAEAGYPVHETFKKSDSYLKNVSWKWRQWPAGVID